MPKITEMFAFVAADKGPDDEGVIAMLTKLGPAPMVGADMARADALRPWAQAVANECGTPVRLLRFSVREELDVLHPVSPTAKED